jgi:hypothetical protein
MCFHDLEAAVSYNLHIPLFSHLQDVTSKQDSWGENILIQSYIVEDSLLLQGKRFVFLRGNCVYELNWRTSHPYFIRKQTCF